MEATKMSNTKKTHRLFAYTLSLLLAFSLFSGFKSGAYAASGISVTYNGIAIAFTQEPIIKDGRTLVPLRAIFEAMGMTVLWYPETQSVYAYNAEIAIGLQIGNSSATISSDYYGDIDVFLDVAPQIINGRTLVPARFIGESSGADVSWLASSRTVVITNSYDRYFGDLEGAIGSVNYLYKGYISATSGLADGFGSCTYSSGSSYIGTFKNGLLNGQGTYYYYDGGEYVGQFVAGYREGQGTYYYPSGDMYVGAFSNDVRSGYGTYYWVNGTQATGTWYNDSFVG